MAASMVESLSRMEKEILVFVLGRYSDIQTAQALQPSHRQEARRSCLDEARIPEPQSPLEKSMTRACNDLYGTRDGSKNGTFGAMSGA